MASLFAGMCVGGGGESMTGALPTFGKQTFKVIMLKHIAIFFLYVGQRVKNSLQHW